MKAKCPDCQRFHEIDTTDYALFGFDCYCIKCTDQNHLDFMRKNGTKMNLSCVKGCRCGFGDK